MIHMKFDSSAFVAEAELFQVIWKHAIQIGCASDRELFHQGDEPIGLFLVKSGDAIMILEDDRGAEVAQFPMMPGALLGLPASISNRPYSMTAIAKQGAEVGFVSRREFSALMTADPSVAMMVLHVLAAEVRSARLGIVESSAGAHGGG